MDPLFSMPTAAWLSENTIISLPVQESPHLLTAKRTDRASLKLMCKLAAVGKSASQSVYSQSLSATMPEALVQLSTSMAMVSLLAHAEIVLP